MNIEKLKLLVTTVQKLSLARDIETITDVVRKAARSLTGADGATFVLKDNNMCYYVDEDAIEPLWKGQRFQMTACISGWTMINKKWAIIEDIYEDYRIPIEAYRPTFVKSLAMVPIRTIDPIGAIGNYWGNKHSPSPEEMFILQSLADITSVSIENVYACNELTEQNKSLYDIAFLQSHQVRVPVVQIQGLFNIFNFEDLQHPDNPEIFRKLKTVADSFDEIIKDITNMTSKLKFNKP
ncbi:GAF domain-containing protein [Sediminibacterium sp.]|uniref:GAF domain-containing protein n=1 Tax=Sediminibacterium sp. TaxID=1917865 RepID=UPI0027371DC0|nr:GAF domain-containing protein [Sediminibacterium sp.]MDP3392997.1 GAF domain-containing protein [Sediminibacterium sp.]MDP3567203.1 GAF domain-containing protein [Sediminibacterium sp.]